MRCCIVLEDISVAVRTTFCFPKLKAKKVDFSSYHHDVYTFQIEKDR